MYDGAQGDYYIYENLEKTTLDIAPAKLEKIITMSNPVGAPVYISKEEIDRL